MLAGEPKGIECRITEVGPVGESEENANIGIAIGGNSEDSGGAGDGIFDDLLGMRGLLRNSRIGHSLAEQVEH